MALILNIDTASQNAGISLAENGEVLSQKTNEQLTDHASWLHPAIQEIMLTNQLAFHQLQAVAVVAGPGSYTGLRVGMAAAKGLCFATKKPLIAVNTLELMAFAIKENFNVSDFRKTSPLYYCPMIDARRMEVFTALYDNELNELMAPCSLVLPNDVLDGFIEKSPVVFFGNGSKKMTIYGSKKNVLMSDYNYTTKDVALLTYKNLSSFRFTNLAYSEPFYLKDFYFHQKNG